MRRVSICCALLAVFVALPAAAQTAPQSHFDGQSWWDYVKVLADDNMEGRETGSDGLRRAQAFVVEQLKNALEADYVVLGGGNAKLLKELPPGARLGDNSTAFTGGFRLWEDPSAHSKWNKVRE